MNSTWAVLWLHSRSSRSGSYESTRMIGHILGYLPVSPNHMLALITVTLKAEITCVLERWISPYRSTRCHKPGDEHLTASLAIPSCTVRCCVCSSAWRELRADIIKAVDKSFGWCDRGPADVLPSGCEKMQEEILQNMQRI
jgi:hypothetical protein